MAKQSGLELLLHLLPTHYPRKESTVPFHIFRQNEKPAGHTTVKHAHRNQQFWPDTDKLEGRSSQEISASTFSVFRPFAQSQLSNFPGLFFFARQTLFISSIEFMSPEIVIFSLQESVDFFLYSCILFSRFLQRDNGIFRSAVCASIMKARICTTRDYGMNRLQEEERLGSRDFWKAQCYGCLFLHRGLKTSRCITNAATDHFRGSCLINHLVVVDRPFMLKTDVEQNLKRVCWQKEQKVSIKVLSNSDWALSVQLTIWS